LVAALLIFFVMIATPVAAQPRQLCLSCHPAHYEARGECTGCHLGNAASLRKNIAHAGIRAGKYTRFIMADAGRVKSQELLLEQYACRRCHLSSGRGNHLAANLDSSAIRNTAQQLASSIRQPVAGMPDFGMNDDRVTTLVNAILTGSKGHENDTLLPVKVHFSVGRQGADVFSTKCGSCHQLLSRRLGALGTSRIAPNLSGLLTEYYPKTFRYNDVWTFRKLEVWLKNPRDVKPLAGMLPVVLKKTELNELDSILFGVPILLK
jgi:cytochrome c2